MSENWSKLATGLGYESETEMWQDLYTEEELSIPQLSERLGFGTHTIRRRLMLCSIERRGRGGPRVMTYQRQRLFRLDQRALWSMRTGELAEMLNISTTVVSKYKQLMKGEQDGVDGSTKVVLRWNL